jgi:beta-glucosidase
MSFPRHLGQIPINYNHLNTGRPFLGQSFTYTSHYIDESNLPLFTFGDGLSYTTFEFSEWKDLSNPNQLQFEIKVKNTGMYAGYVIIPVYLENPIAPVALANRQLVGMSKVMLQPGASQVVTVDIDAQFLTYIDRDYQRQPLKGKLTFTTGQRGQWLTLTKEMK